MRLDSVSINYNCPLGAYRFANDGKRKNRIAAYLPCLDADKTIKLVATTRTGQQVRMHFKQLDQFRDKCTQPACGKQPTSVLRRFLFWKFYKGNLYKKYKFFRKDLE